MNSEIDLSSFISAFIGGFLALFGVLISHIFQAKENFKNLRLENMPLLVFIGLFKSYSDKNTNADTVVSLEIKNCGKGILKNLDISIDKENENGGFSINERSEYLGLSENRNIILFYTKIDGTEIDTSSLKNDEESMQYEELEKGNILIKAKFQDVYDNDYSQEVSIKYGINNDFDSPYQYFDIISSSGPTFVPKLRKKVK